MVPVLIINLDRSPDRLVRMQTETEQAGIAFERVAAVDGLAGLPREIAAYFASPHTLTPSQVGCSASHMKVMRLIVERNLPAALVLEDDTSLDRELPAIIDEVLSKVPAGWDVVRLCGHPKRAFRPLAQLAGNNSLVQFSRIPIGRAGYLVSRRGAQKLLKPRKVCRPGDVEMTHPWNLDDLDTYGVVPPPVRQERKKLPSTIGARRGDISRWQRAIPDPRRTIFSIRKLGLLWWLRCCCHNVLGRHVVSTAQ